MSLNWNQRQKLLKEFGWGDNTLDFDWDNKPEIPKYNTPKEKNMRDNITITSTGNILRLVDEPANNCEGKTPGFIVIHQNIGSLPPANAEMFCERVKDQFTKSKEWLEFKAKFPNWSFVLLPSRTEESHVEVFHEQDGERKQVIGEIAKIMTDREPPIQDTPELQKRVENYILMMLGAPVIKLEFTEDQLEFCYRHTLNLMHDYHQRIRKFTFTESYRAQSEGFLCSGALAHAKIMLGKIRQHQNVPEDGTHLHPDDLYNEGKQDLAAWKKLIAPQQEETSEEDA